MCMLGQNVTNPNYTVKLRFQCLHYDESLETAINEFRQSNFH